MTSRARPTSGGWWTGLPDRSGMAAYVHLIRGPDDPEGKRAGRGNSTAWREKFAKSTVPHWREKILEHLQDGRARTFNSIAVGITGQTADVVSGKGPDIALWQLVDEQRLEYTPGAPVMFRLRREAQLEIVAKGFEVGG